MHIEIDEIAKGIRHHDRVAPRVAVRSVRRAGGPSGAVGIGQDQKFEDLGQA